MSYFQMGSRDEKGLEPLSYVFMRNVKGNVY